MQLQLPRPFAQWRSLEGAHGAGAQASARSAMAPEPLGSRRRVANERERCVEDRQFFWSAQRLLDAGANALPAREVQRLRDPRSRRDSELSLELQQLSYQGWLRFGRSFQG